MKTIFNHRILNSVMLSLLVGTAAVVKAQTNDEIIDRFKMISDSSSSVNNTIIHLSDRYGPRLMGTPNYYKSVQWIKTTLASWGINNTELSNFDDKNRGWELVDFDLKMTAPVSFKINGFPHAYTRSSKNNQEGELVLLKKTDDIFSLKGKLKGKILLLTESYRPASSSFEPMARELSEELLLRAKANEDPNDRIIGYHSRRSITDVFKQRAAFKKKQQDFFSFCEAEGVIAILEPSYLPYGILHVDGNSSVPSFNKQDDLSPIPSFVVSNEHFGRILRLIELGENPKITVSLSTRTHTNPEFNVNLIAEIPGTDPNLKNEVVIFGAHLDTWHAGTGAVDNAANCAVMMEAIRLLKSSGVQPKRTIRLILWGGEEQVFAGSKHYTHMNIGDMQTYAPKRENNKISAYLNLDNGAGKIRGLYLMGNKKIAPYFAQYLQPFPKSQTLTAQNANQSDHELLDYHNVPAFQFIQDPLDYLSAVHHTNLDTYEYVPMKTQDYNAILVSYLAYSIAQEEEMLPRKEFNSPIPSTEGNAHFELKGFEKADTVFLVGDFNNWNMFGTPLFKTDTGWKTSIDLPKGKYYYKYIIDGSWTADPNTATDNLVKDGKGHGGLTIKRVEK